MMLVILDLYIIDHYAQKEKQRTTTAKCKLYL